MTIIDIDFHHDSGATDVQWAGYTCDIRRSAGTDMVGIDVQANDVEAVWCTQVSHHATQRFGQYHRRASMDNPHVLTGAVVHRERTLEKVIAQLCQLHAHMFGQGVFHQGADVIQRDVFFPDSQWVLLGVKKVLMTTGR